MNIKLKPLTVVVDHDQTNDRAAITIRNDQGMVVIGPLVHYHLSERGTTTPTETINNHLVQIKRLFNVVKLDSNMPGIELT